MSSENSNQFKIFLETFVNSRYARRWLILFNRGKKGMSKIDLFQAWKIDFLKTKHIDWIDSISDIPQFVLEYNCKEFIYFGIGHSDIKIEAHPLHDLLDVLKNNLEGVFIFDNNKIAIINNHSGQIRILLNN